MYQKHVTIGYIDIYFTFLPKNHFVLGNVIMLLVVCTFQYNFNGFKFLCYLCNEIHNLALGHDVILNKIELEVTVLYGTPGILNSLKNMS